MKRLILILSLILAPLSAVAAEKAAVIAKVGHYTSEKHTSELVVKERGADVVFSYTHTGADGRKIGTNGECKAGQLWAFLIEDEITLWIYRGGDTILRVTYEDLGGPQVSFTSGQTILQLKTERDAIPAPLLEFIDKANP
jgi:hypothetical protein